MQTKAFRLAFLEFLSALLTLVLVPPQRRARLWWWCTAHLSSWPPRWSALSPWAWRRTCGALESSASSCKSNGGCGGLNYSHSKCTTFMNRCNFEAFIELFLKLQSAVHKKIEDGGIKKKNNKTMQIDVEYSLCCSISKKKIHLNISTTGKSNVHLQKEWNWGCGTFFNKTSNDINALDLLYLLFVKLTYEGKVMWQLLKVKLIY